MINRLWRWGSLLLVAVAFMVTIYDELEEWWHHRRCLRNG